MSRISAGDCIGFCGLVFAAAIFSPIYGAYSACIALALVVGVVAYLIGLKSGLRASERQRLADECESQHQALLRGDDEWAIYGRGPQRYAVPTIHSRWGYTG